MNRFKPSVRDLCLIAVFAAIMAVMAQISIPMPYGVPMTMQTFAVPLAGFILGAKRGTVSALIYVLLGAVGLPVFTQFTGGLGIVFGATGGFILSFPILAWTAGFGAVKRNWAWLIFWLATGAAINYVCGMTWFCFVMSSGLKTAFTACVLPFIPTAVIKIALVAVLGRQIKKALMKGTRYND